MPASPEQPARQPARPPAVLPPLPSLFSPIRLAEGQDAMAAGVAHAASHGAGTLLWVDSPRAVQAAVVLEPEWPLAAARPALFAAGIALADALVVLGPPELPVTLRWPATLVVNGGVAGQARLAAPPGSLCDAVPAWLVVGIDVAVQGGPAEPGLQPGRTVLFEEGFAGVPVPDLVATWARHLMAGLAEWQREGFGALSDKLLARLEVEDWMGDARRGLDPASGALVLERDGARSRHPLPGEAA